MLLATVRDGGVCPCPRCLIPKVDIDKIGHKLDSRYRLTKARQYVGDIIRSARRFIYTLGLNVNGAAVERLLFEHSLVPTRVRTYTRPYHSWGADIPFSLLSEHFRRKARATGS